MIRKELGTEADSSMDLAQKDPPTHPNSALHHPFPPPLCLMEPGPAWRQGQLCVGGPAQAKEAPSFSSGLGASGPMLADNGQVLGALLPSGQTSPTQQPGL